MCIINLYAPSYWLYWQSRSGRLVDGKFIVFDAHLWDDGKLDGKAVKWCRRCGQMRPSGDA